MHAPNVEAADVPADSTLVRVRLGSSRADLNHATEVMREAGEETDLVQERLSKGDELFGWLLGGRIICFGWMTRRDRKIGPVQLSSHDATVFLYNFYTAPWARGRGLYRQLLLQIRCVMGSEGISHFIIDANQRNPASLTGIRHAGFQAIARASFISFFERWYTSGSLTPIAPPNPVLTSIYLGKHEPDR